MRDAKRLDSFYDEVNKLHQEYFPDMRFGQLCINFFGWLNNRKKIDAFFTEEDFTIKYLKEYIKEMFEEIE